jgi:hypothetical protein
MNCSPSHRLDGNAQATDVKIATRSKSPVCPTDIVFHENEDATGVHVNIALQFKASGTDTSGNDYKTSFIANGQFEGVAAFYDVQYHAVFVGHGDAPNFAYDGIVRVFVAGGKAVGASILSLSSTCTQ